MPFFSQWKIFQKIAMGIMLTFMGLMGAVCVAAYSRPSGATRQDMAQAQFKRYQAVHKKEIAEKMKTKTD